MSVLAKRIIRIRKYGGLDRHIPKNNKEIYPRKAIRIDKDVHQKIKLIKLYSEIPVEDMTSALIRKALNSSFLEELLMEFLGKPEKVKYVLKAIEINERE